jgi:putative peptidoglycan lipid II flippase
MEIKGLHEAAYLLAFFAFLSQVLALVRDKLLAYSFGAGHDLDLYYAAFRIPDLIFVTIASVVSASVLVPFFIERTSKDADGGRAFIDTVFSAFFFVIIVVSVIAFFLVPYALPILLPGFKNDASFAELVSATRLMLLSPLFLGLSNFFSSITQMHRRFLVYALSPLLYNLGIIVGIVALYPIFGLQGLVAGVILGAFLHMALQIPFIIQKGMMPRVRLAIQWESIKRVVILSLPRTLTLSANQLASFFLVALASLMVGGSISIFNLAYNLQSVPLTIIGVSYSSAVFPTLSKFFVSGERDKFLNQMVISARHIIFWSAPVTVTFVVLRAQIVRVIYGAGNFDWSNTRLTAAVLALFIFSVAAQSLILLFVRAYYAEGATRRPLLINIVSALIIVVLGYALDKLFFAAPVFRFFFESLLRVSGQAGTSVIVLPLAYTIGVSISAVLHWAMFERDYPGFSRNIWRNLFQSISASIIMGYVMYLALNIFDDIFGLTTSAGVFLQGFYAGIVGIIVFILLLLALRNTEIREVWSTLHKKFWKAKVVVPDAEHL